MPPIIPQHLPFTVVLLLLLVLARLFGEVMERFGHPAMIGEILAGFILGPSLLSLVEYTGDLKVLSDLGVFLLIVLAGMEIDPHDVKNSLKGRHSWIAIMGFLIPMALGLLIGFMMKLNGMLTLFIGLCIAITALPVSVRILMDLGKLQTPIGQRIISAAIFNDVVSLLILGIILDFNDFSTSIEDLVYSVGISMLKLLVFILIIYLAYRLLAKAMASIPIVQSRVNGLVNVLRGKESLFALVIVFVLLFASTSEVLGLHFVIGAFFGAMMLNKEFLGKENFAKMHTNTSGITMGFLAPIFFATMGIQFNLLALNNIYLLILILSASFISKIAGGYLGGRLAGFGHRESYTLGIGLNARGIMELVIANIALQNGFIDTSVYSILVLMGVVTTLVSPYFLKKSFVKLDLKNSLASRVV